MPIHVVPLPHVFDSSMTCDYCGVAAEHTMRDEPCPKRSAMAALARTGMLAQSEDNTAEFRRELTSVINRYSKENGSSTPDYILADYLIGCLAVFDKAVVERARWFVDSSGDGLERKIEAMKG